MKKQIKEKDIKKWKTAEWVNMIPNYVMKKIYWEYFVAYIKQFFNFEHTDFKHAILKMIKGNIDDFVEYLKNIMDSLANRDLMNFDEKYMNSLI